MAKEVVSLAQRYVLEEPLADGGMARVWRARDDVLARTVTVKILHPQLVSDPVFLEGFRTEALAAARLSHPNIVAIYDTGAEKHGGELMHFIVMEYCGGGSLAQALARAGSMDPQRTAEIADHACEALAYAHRNGSIHRDIKPENILFSDQGVLKVGDFGIARSAFETGDVTTTTSLLGNVTYISPEQADGRDVDERSDLYSLGAVLYHCLVGRPPFERNTALAVAAAHRTEEPPPLRSIRADIPRAVDAVIMKALAKDPERRFVNAHEMGEAIRSATGSGQTQVLRMPPKREPKRITSPARPRPDLRWVAGAFLLLALLLLGALALGRDPSPPAGRTQDDNERSERAGSSEAIEPESVSDFDPHGGDGEHPDEVPLAHDGDGSTAWTTSNYNDPIHLQKPGVGLLFDLGSEVEVGAVQVDLDRPGYGLELRAGNSESGDETGFDLVDGTTSTDQEHEVDAGSTSARYWLVWLTRFPGDGAGRASVAEVRFLAP